MTTNRRAGHASNGDWFNRHAGEYVPPPLEEIDADLDKASAGIMALLSEVHS